MFAKLKPSLLPPLLVLMGIGLAVTGFHTGREFKAIADHGQVAEASVDRVTWKEKAVSGREKGFKIEVHFETAAQQPVKATLSVSKADGQRLRDSEASTVRVKYLPEAPTTVILADATDDSAVMMSAGSTMALVGVGIFLYRRRKAASAPASAT